jgi:WD40 repeat protein
MTNEYSAFVSYSHALDGKLAPALQNEIEVFAKPWYRMRMVRLFRDETNLSVAPGLWGRIEEALDRSQHLILLASPQSAQSRWVKREVAHWLNRKSASTILIVITDGELVWQESRNDFDWNKTNSLPSELANVFDREPLYGDMRWARDPSNQLSMKDPRFAQTILSLSATIQGRLMDDLGGEAVRNHRVARRMAAGAVSAICLFAVGAMMFAWLAIDAANRATKRNTEAQQRESLRLAFSSQSETDNGKATDGASLAIAALPSRFDVKTGWLPWSQKLNPDRPIVAEASGAVIKALALQREIRYLAPRDDETNGSFISSGFLKDPNQVYALSKSGRYRVWNVTSGDIIRDVKIPTAEPKFIAIDDNGDRAIVAGSNGDVIYWSPSEKFPTTTIPVKSPERDGIQDRLFASFDSQESRLLLIPPDDKGYLFAVPSGTPIARLPYEPVGIGQVEVAKTSDGTRFIFDASGKMVYLDASTGLPANTSPSIAADADAVSVSFDGVTLLSRGELGGRAGAFVWRRNVNTGNFAITRNIELQPRDRIIISPDGRFVAKVTPSGIVQVGETRGSLKSKLLSVGISIADIVFSNDGNVLLARLDNGGLVVWRARREGWFDGVTVGPGPGYSGVLTKDGLSIVAGVLTMSLIERNLKGALAVWDRLSGRELQKIEMSDWVTKLTLSPDGKLLLCIFVNGSIEGWDVGDWTKRFNVQVGPDADDSFVSADFSPDGKFFYAAKRNGVIVQADSQTGREAARMTLDNGRLTEFAASSDGSFMAATFENAPGLVWSSGSLEHHAFGSVSDTPRHIAFSPNGKLLAATTRSGNIGIFQSDSANVVATRSAYGALLSALTFDHFGRRLASVSENGTIFIWGIDDASLDAVVNYGQVRVYSISFSPDDRWILTTAHDGLARMWEIGTDLPDLISVTARSRPHCLSDDKTKVFALSTSAKDHTSRVASCTPMKGEFVSQLE